MQQRTQLRDLEKVGDSDVVELAESQAFVGKLVAKVFGANAKVTKLGLFQTLVHPLNRPVRRAPAHSRSRA